MYYCSETFFLSSQGFDPLAKGKFIPKHKKKGRSSAGSVEKRKKQVAHEDQRVSNAEYKFDAITLWSFCYICTVWLICLDLFTPQDVIRKTVEDKMTIEKERKERKKTTAALSNQKSALDRFKK